MTEKDIIKKIEMLKEIKPTEKWVDLSLAEMKRKSGIAREESFDFWALFAKPAFSVSLGVLVSFFGAGFAVLASQDSMPGDWLYAVKISAEKFERNGYGLVSDNKKFEKDLVISGKRISEFRLLLERVDANNRLIDQEQANKVASDYKKTAISLEEYLDEVVGNDVEESVKAAQLVQEQTKEFGNALATNKVLPQGIKDEVDKVIESTKRVQEKAQAVIDNNSGDKEFREELRIRITEKMEETAENLESFKGGKEEIEKIEALRREVEDLMISGDLISALEKITAVEHLME